MKTENVFVIHRFKIAILPQPILDRGEHMISKRIPAVILILLAASICFVSAYVYSQENNIVTLTIMNRAYYYVDNNTSDVDSSADKGTHSNFTAQQHGPDFSFDNLTEEAKSDWWNTDYANRKQILINNNVGSTLDSGYSIFLVMDTTALVSCGKMLSNGNDLRIVYWNGSGWTELDRDIINMETNSTQIWFKTQAEISASGNDSNYYVYYGNSDPGSPPSYWSDSMGSDFPSKVYAAADDFQEHNYQDSPDGWTPVGSFFMVGSSDSDRFMNSTADGQYIFAGNSSWTDYVVKLKMQDAGTASVSYPGIAVRVTDVNNLVYLGWRNSSCLTLWKRIGGSYTLLNDWTIPDVGSAWHTIEIRVKDQNLQVCHDGFCYGNASLNAGELTSGNVGIFSSYGTHSHWDDYIVREYVSSEPSTSLGPEERSHELDLEVQWANVDYSETNEELCIYGGTMGSESLRVDVWTGASWQNIISGLSSGWNNVSVSTYLASSTLTIRFVGTSETADATQDNWEIDATLLHVWT